VHATAALALGQLGKFDAIEPLKLPLGAGNSMVRRAAIRALSYFDQMTLDVLVSEAEAILLGLRPRAIFKSVLQRCIVKMLGDMEIVDEAINNRLMRYFIDNQLWEVKVEVATALGKIGHRIPDEATSYLYKLRSLHEFPKVREAADDALAKILSMDEGIENN
jgi:HEAT repeat protein